MSAVIVLLGFLATGQTNGGGCSNQSAVYYPTPYVSHSFCNERVVWQGANPCSQYRSLPYCNYYRPIPHESVIISDESDEYEICEPCTERTSPLTEEGCQRYDDGRVVNTQPTTTPDTCGEHKGYEQCQAAVTEAPKRCMSLEEYPDAIRSSSPALIDLPKNNIKAGNDFLLLPLTAAIIAAKLHVKRSCLERGEVIVYVNDPDYALTITGAVHSEKIEVVVVAYLRGRTKEVTRAEADRIQSLVAAELPKAFAKFP